MADYTKMDRNKDFEFFINNYQKLFAEYGHKFIAIKNQNILGAFDSVLDTVNSLSNEFEFGTYIIQECTGEESAYKTSIMRLMIRG